MLLVLSVYCMFIHLRGSVVSVVSGRRDEPSHDEDLPLDGGHAGLLDAVGQRGRARQPPPAAEQVARRRALLHAVPVLGCWDVGRICSLSVLYRILIVLKFDKISRISVGSLL